MKPVKVILMIVGIIILGTTLCFAAPNPSGDFILADFDDETSFNTPAAALTRITLDGNGNGTYQNLYTSEADTLESGNFTYSIAPDGSLTIQEEGETVMDHGIFSADGNMFTLAYTAEGLGIAVGIKKSSGMSNASLNGSYIASYFGDETDSNLPWAGLARITLDGNGHATYQDLYTTDELEGGAFTYSIADDGQLTITIAGFQVHGMVSADGSIFTLAETAFPSEAGIDIGIKESSGMSNASANGCYLISQYEDHKGQNDPWSAITRICLDGNGNATYQDLYTSDNELESASFTYSIAANGQLTIYTEGMQFHGIVSADGNTLTVAITEIEWPAILFGIKESAVKIKAIPGIPLLLLDD